MLCGVIDISANAADVLAGSLLLGEIDVGKDGGDGVVEIHDALGFEVLVALGRVGATIDGGVITDERADAVLRLTGSREVVEDHRQLVVMLLGFWG